MLTFWNTGLETTSEWTKTSKIVKLQGGIHADLSHQEKSISNGVDLTVKHHFHKPEFCLLSTNTAPAHKITIMDAIIYVLYTYVLYYVKKIELIPSAFNATNTVLNDKNVQNAITRTIRKVFTMPRGQQIQHIDNAFRTSNCMFLGQFGIDSLS